MPQPGKFDIPAMDGGQNDGMDPAGIKDSEFELLSGYIPFGQKITRRGPISNIVRKAGDNNALFNSIAILSLNAADHSEGTVILGSRTGGIYKLVGVTVAGVERYVDVQIIPATSSYLPAISSYPWHFVQANGVAYAIRRGVGIRRFTDQFHSPAGINKPSNKLTAVQGAAGSLVAGAYQWVYTYMNSRTFAESNPSDPSDPLTLAASKRADLSGFQPSTDTQVDTIRIYRTLADQTDEYFHVADIPVTDSTYTDNTVTDGLGDLVSTRNGMPPQGARSGCLWEDCLVVHDGVDVFISEVLKPESFADQVLNVYRNDGAEITTVCGWGKRLVVGKTNKIHTFVRNGPGNYERSTLDELHGCISHKSMRVIGAYLYWFAGDNIYRSNGYASEPICTTQIRRLLDRYVPDHKLTDHICSSTVWPQRNLYMLHLPLDGADHNTHTILYNYVDGTFAVIEYPPVFISGGGQETTTRTELIVNGDAESGLTGWNVVNVFADGIPHTGAAAFRFTVSAEGGEDSLDQNVAIANPGPLTFSAYTEALPQPVTLFVEIIDIPTGKFLDSSGNWQVLEQQIALNNTNSYTLNQFTFNPLSTPTTINVAIYADFLADSADGEVDNISLIQTVVTSVADINVVRQAPADVTDPATLDPTGLTAQTADLLGVFNDNRAYRFLNRDLGSGEDDYTDSNLELRKTFIYTAWRGKRFSKDGFLLALRRLWLMVVTNDERRASATINVYLNGSDTPYKTLSVENLAYPGKDPWKLLGINTSRHAADLVQLEMVYTDKPKLSISRMALDVMQFTRTHRVRNRIA